MLCHCYLNLCLLRISNLHTFTVLSFQAYQIETLASTLGVARIAKAATVCLLLNYMHAIATGLLVPSFNPIAMIGGHSALAAILVLRFRQLNAASMASVKAYYKHIWDLFYLEYALYTLI